MVRYEPVLSPKFETEWSTDVTRVELINSSLYKSFEYLDSIRREDCDLKPRVFTPEDMIPEHKELINLLGEGIVSTFCDYLDYEPAIITGRYTFVKDVVAQNNLPSDEYGGVCGYDLKEDFASGCAWFPGVVWTGISLGTERKGVVYTEERRVSIAAHEIFHYVHDSIDPGPGGQSPPPGSPLYRPVWFIEGGGEYFGRMLVQYLELQDYGTFTPSDRYGAWLDSEYLSELANFETIQQRAFGTENYYAGQIAMEFMIASQGLEALLDVWVNLGKGLQFDQAFEKALGISVSDFYDKYRVLHQNLYAESLPDR
jgi:hypothetical protein